MFDGPAHPLGPALRRWRMLHRVKQAHAAEWFGVAQSTVSRWESGGIAPEPAERKRIEALLTARLDSAADQALARLVSESPRPVHLICDLTHRLIALSAARAAGLDGDWIGRSLWRFATPAIAAHEARLNARGWFDAPQALPCEFDPGDNGAVAVPVRRGLCRWTRLTLSDGKAVRLVETLQ